MNNEPVAWMNRLGRLEYKQGNGFEIPLYIHPVKEHTDDEIADLIKATNDEIGMINIRTFDFVKVLLRKAQEK